MMYFTGGEEEDKTQPIGIQSLLHSRKGAEDEPRGIQFLSDMVRYPEYLSFFFWFITCAHLYL